MKPAIKLTQGAGRPRAVRQDFRGAVVLDVEDGSEGHRRAAAR